MSKVIDFDHDSTDIFGLYQYLREAVEAELAKAVDGFDVVEPLKSAIRYSIFPGGKRIRPLFCLMFAHDLGADPHKLLSAAAALELIHSASLIHDDLPALDNDDMRRGKLSCHKAFSEGTAILAGDVIFPLAIQMVMRCSYTEEVHTKMVNVMCSGFVDLCNGQQRDILPAEMKGNIAEISRLKTGSLFSIASRFAGIATSQESDSLLLLEEIGLLIGQYFQLVDDYTDIYSADSDTPELVTSLAEPLSQGASGLFEGVLAETQSQIDGSLDRLREIVRPSAGQFRGANFILEGVYSSFEAVQKTR